MADWQQVLDELIRTRGNALQRYGFLLCGNDADASDLVQEAAARVFARARRRWSVADVEPYVRRVMLNCFLDQRRRAGRFGRLLPRLAEAASGGDEAQSAAERIDVVRALDRLTRRQRACVVARYYEDLPVSGIAKDLGCSEGAVKRHLHDALERLGDVLAQPTLRSE